MKIFRTNILSNDVLKVADAICFTSNGITKKDGKLVMGAGVAKVFRDTFVGIDQEAGTLVKKNGNICQVVRDTFVLGKPLSIVAFPTKYHWKDDSDLDLIEKSASELYNMANQYGWKTVFLPKPGCNNGRLDWNDVKALLQPKLDNRFIITFLPKD